MNGIQKNEKGFMLLTSLLIIAVIEIFAIAFFARSHVFMQSSERNKNKIIALQMAEAGLDKTIVDLGADFNNTGTSYTALGNQGGYQTTVCWQGSDPPCPAGVSAPSGLVRFVQATGFAPGSDTSAKAYETRTISAYVQSRSVAFAQAAFGETSSVLNLSGNGTVHVDSYNSNNGAYGGANIGNNGDIASDGDVTLIGNTTVDGDIAGPVSTTGNAGFTGDNNASPQYDCSVGATNLPNLGDLTVNGNNTTTLGAGSYHYSSVNITGNGFLNLTGPVVLYVDGAVNIGGNGVATSSNLPQNLIIIATGSGSINFSGNGGLYGGVYAPASSVSITGNGTFYGSAYALDFSDSGNGAIHYDEALQNVGSLCNQISLLHWRERNTFYNAS